jgi:hypothetical protein
VYVFLQAFSDHLKLFFALAIGRIFMWSQSTERRNTFFNTILGEQPTGRIGDEEGEAKYYCQILLVTTA